MVDRSVVVRLIADNASFNSAMNQSAQQVGNIGRQAEETSSRSVAAFGRIKTAAITLIGVGAAKSGQELNILKENAQIAFTTMLGGAEAARAKIAEIEAFSRTTVVGLDQWIKGGQLLTAYGLEAAKIVPILQNIADAAAASGQGVDVVPRIILALGQIQSKGRVMAQEMLQLTEAGIPAWQMLADVIGVDVKTAMAMAEKGMIDSKTALDALSTGIEQRFGGTAAAAVGTLGGSWTSFFTNLKYGAATAIAPLTELQKAAAAAGGTLATSFGGVISTILTPVAALLTPIVSLFSSLPGPIMAGAAALGVMALARGPIGTLGASIGSMVTQARLGFPLIRAQMAETMRYQQALATSSGITATRFQLSMSAMTMAAQRFGRGLMAAVGGPLGLVLIGATILMTAWASSNSNAKAQAEENEAALRSLKETLDQVSGAVTNLTTKKLIDEWVGDGTDKKFKEVGTSAAEATAAIKKGGDELQAYKQKLATTLANNATGNLFEFNREELATLIAGHMGGADALDEAIQRVADSSGRTFDDVERLYYLFREVGTGADQGITTIANAFGNAAIRIEAGAVQTRTAFEETAKAAANAAGVVGEDVVKALDAAYASGGDVKQALMDVGLSSSQADTVLRNLDGIVTKNSDGMYVMAGAAATAAAGVDTITDAAKGAAEALKAAISQAQALRTSVTNAVTSFVNPAGAWDSAKTAANSGTSSRAPKKVAARDNPAVVAAGDATKAGQKAKDAAVKNAKAIKDATVKTAKDIQKSIQDQAKADVKLAKDAQDAAQKRMDAAKKEADELAKLADQKKKAAEDSKSLLEDAEFRARAAQVAVDAAKLGLANSDPSNRTQWERAYEEAVRESEAATKDLEVAKQNDKTASEQSEAATRNSTAATKEQEQADLDLQTAKDNTATVSEESSARQARAAEEYAAAQERAQERFTAAQEAAQARYDELLAQKELAEANARKSTESMATGGSDAVAGMVKDIEPSLAQWKEMLQKQKDDQLQWAADMVEISKVAPEIAKYMIEQGPAMAGAAREMVKGGPQAIKEMVPLIQASMPEWNAAIVNGLLAGIPGSQAAMARLGSNALDAMMAELMAPDGPQRFNEIMVKYGISAQDRINQWGALTWNFDVNTNYADDKMQEWFSRQQNKLQSGPIGRAPNTYGYNTAGGYANGGWIRGGSGSKDDVPFWGMGGEFVVKKSAARKHKELLEQINGGGGAYQLPSAQVTQAPSPMPQPAPSASSSVTNFYYTISNPIAEPTSVTTNRTLQYAAAGGSLG